MSEGTKPEDAARAGGAAAADGGAGRGSAAHEGGSAESAGTAAIPRATAGAEASQAGRPEESKSSFAALIGNTALLGAVLIYMGWNYENSLLEYFQIPVFSVNVGTAELALKGLVPLFQSDMVFFAAIVVTVLVLASQACTVRELARKTIGDATALMRKLAPRVIASAAGRVHVPASWMLIIGLLVTAVVLPVTWVNVSAGTFVGWFASHRDGAYFVLALLATGQLLSAWPIRRSGVGPFAYSLALIVAAVCLLWGAGIYAGSLGSQAARSFAMALPRQTAVTVYSVMPLDLSGAGVNCQRVRGATGYPYVCTGLRLLYVQSGTYDLLPVRWTSQYGRTYVLDDSNQVRIELSHGS